MVSSKLETSSCVGGILDVDEDLEIMVGSVRRGETGCGILLVSD